MKRLSERVSRIVHGGGFSEGRAVLRARHRGHLERASSLAVRAHDGRVRRLRVEEIREGFRPEFGSAEFTHLGGRLRRRRRRDGVGGFAREELHPPPSGRTPRATPPPRASSVAVGQLLLRPVSSHVTSMATSNSWSTSSSVAGARMRSAARCASTSVGLNRTPTSNSSVNAFASATVRIARSSASSSAGGSASIPAASRKALASRSTTRRRAASMSVDMAFSVLRSFSSHARADPGRVLSRISRFTVAELTIVSRAIGGNEASRASPRS